MMIAGLIAVAAVLVSSGRALPAEHRLHEDLLKTYNHFVRPTEDPLKSIIVSLDYSLVLINGVDERTESVTLNGFLSMIWQDDFIHWVPTNYSNITVLFLPPGKIWTPGIVFENSIAQRFFDLTPFNVHIDYHGRISWDAGGPITLLCQFDLTYYPWDEQICSVRVGTWAGTESQIHLIGGVFDAESYYQKHGEWHIAETWVSNYTFWEDGMPFSEVHFFLRMQRKSLFHIFNILLPVVLLSILDGLVFILPVESGEKIALAVTVMLAFAVLQLSFNETLPKNKDYLTLLEIYTATFMIVSALTVVAAVIVLRTYHRNEKIPLSPKDICFVRLMQKKQCRKGVREGGGESSSEERTALAEPLTWRMVATGLDRLGWVICATFTGTMTTVMMIIMVTGRYFSTPGLN